MIRINQIKIPVQKDETSALKKKIQKTLRTNHPYTYQIVRKSLDARDKGNLLHIYTVDVEFERSQDIPRNIIDNKNIMLTKDEKYTFPHRCRDDCNEKTDVSIYRPVIIGAGPAGYFAALQ
ncbi:MAG: FAD-dependent oxidoreductase, partial [Lachnospiraceae bacterium]|nr:FAD-dependent oxidoreductase [Lachnospiraceae bacterium]